MNINLIYDEKSPALQNHNNVSINHIDTIPNNTCKSITIKQTLKHITLNDLQVLILTKMRHQGVVNIEATDIIKLSSALYWGAITLEQYRQEVLNTKGQYSIVEIKSLLEQNGYIVEYATLEDTIFRIRAKRP